MTTIIDTSAPLNGNKTEHARRKCENCKFVSSFTAKGQIQGTLLCMWGPPQVLLLPTPHGLAPVVQYLSVQPTLWCHRFEDRELAPIHRESANALG